MYIYILHSSYYIIYTHIMFRPPPTPSSTGPALAAPGPFFFFIHTPLRSPSSRGSALAAPGPFLFLLEVARPACVFFIFLFFCLQ